MDKVKAVLAVLKKHHFWIVCLLIVVFGALVWTAASADLADQYNQRKNKIDGALKSALAIAGETNHPNDKTVKSLSDLNSSRRQEVLDGWKALYEQQKKQNPWPAVLGQQFLDHVKSRKSGEEISRQYRETYQTFIRDYLPKLFEIVDYRHEEEIEADDAAATGAPAARPPALGMEMGGAAGQQNYRIVGIVDWDETDRERIKQSLWWQGAPTTTQLYMAQEDIWVYQALLSIISATNKGATNHYNAAIKRIAALEIGQASAGAISSGGVDLMAAVVGAGGGMGGGMAAPAMGMGGPMGGGMAEPAMGMGGGMGMEGRMGGPMGGGMTGPGMGMGGPGMGMDGGMGMDAGMGGAMGGEPGMGGAVLSPEDQAVLDFRYVDQNKTPLSATSPQPYAEFKMMPIRMSLLMDQRKIPKLLVECANSNMPVEVQRVRVNPSEGLGPSSGAAGAGRGMAGPAMGMGGPAMGMDRGMGGPAMGMGRPGMDMGGPGMAAGGRPGGMAAGRGMGRPGMGMEGAAMGRPGMAGAGAMGMTEGQSDEVNLNEVPVEIVGIIYIYNPPDLAKVGTGTAQETDQAMPGAPGGQMEPGPGMQPTPPGTETNAAPAAVPQATPAAPATPSGTPAAPVTPLGEPAVPPGTPAAPGTPMGAPPAAATGEQ